MNFAGVCLSFHLSRTLVVLCRTILFPFRSPSNGPIVLTTAQVTTAALRMMDMPLCVVHRMFAGEEVKEINFGRYFVE